MSEIANHHVSTPNIDWHYCIVDLLAYNIESVTLSCNEYLID